MMFKVSFLLWGCLSSSLDFVHFVFTLYDIRSVQSEGHLVHYLHKDINKYHNHCHTKYFIELVVSLKGSDIHDIHNPC